MQYKYLKYEVTDGVLMLTLNRPEHLNAVNPLFCRELIAAFDQADNDDSARVVIVTGAGRAFCAGADLSAGDTEESFVGRFTGTADTAPRRDDGGEVALRIFELKKPVIAAINGPAVGFGITMTLPMDIRLASTTAKMGVVFARRGIILDACAHWFLPRVVGIGTATEWVYSGRVFTAQEALEKRLVTELAAPEDLIPRARAIAAEIANHAAPISIALSRQLMWKMLGSDHPMESHRFESVALNWLYTQPDTAEGVASFIEKRPPRFTMKVSKDMPPFYPWWKPREYKP